MKKMAEPGAAAHLSMMRSRVLRSSAAAMGPEAPCAPLTRYARPWPPASFDERLEAVEERTRPLLHFGDAQGADDPSCCHHLPEQPERRFREGPGEVLDFEPEAQVRFVGAEAQHGLGVGDTRERRRGHFPAAELPEEAGKELLDHGEDVLLLDEGHLQVELVEFSGRAVGAGVLVAEAGRDLEVAVEAGNHQHLLELLRRLRQGVEAAGVDPARHQVVARALGGAAGEDGGLELGEAHLGQAPPDTGDDLRPELDAPVQPGPAQVQEAIGQSGALPHLRLIRHGKGKGIGRREHLQSADGYFDLSGLHRPVDGLGRPLAHLALDPDHGLPGHLCRGCRRVVIRRDHQLGDAVVVAQVQEQYAPVVPLAVYPAAQANGLACVALAQLAAGVGAIGVHGSLQVSVVHEKTRRRRGGSTAGWGEGAFRSRPTPSSPDGGVIVAVIVVRRGAGSLFVP